MIVVRKLNVLKIGFADAFSQDLRGLGITNIARPEQLAHDDALPIAGLERFRGGHFALETHVEEISDQIRSFLMELVPGGMF
jgi:hypothetical protein